MTYCTCEQPTRAVTGEGAPYCERCEELLPDSRDELLIALAKTTASLERKVDALLGMAEDGAKSHPAPDAPADRVDDRQPALVDAVEVARVLGMDRDTIYRRADELGAVRVPGPKGRGRLRFDLDVVRRRLGQAETIETPAPENRRKPQRRHGTGSGSPLLPIEGRAA